MASGPDLFVVCKNCGSQVSPYVTECPYCGQRVRKRAPKIEREDRPPKERRRRSVPSPRRGQRRRRERPALSGSLTGRPWATLTLVFASMAVYVATAVGIERGELAVNALRDEPWTIFTAPFVYDSAWYGFAAVLAVGVFGWLLERRHGPLTVLVLWLAGGSGGMAVADVTGGLAAGANGAALALIAAWALPDLLARRRGEETDSDLLGAGVFAALLLALPVALPEADPLAGLTGLGLGALLGLPLARLSER